MEINKETAVGVEGLPRPERKNVLRAAPDSGKRQAEETSKQNRKKTSGEEQSEKKKAKARRPLGLRITFWLLRKSIVPLLCVIAIVGGLYIGYTILGKRSGEDVFHWETWKHMYDLVFADS